MDDDKWLLMVTTDSVVKFSEEEMKTLGRVDEGVRFTDGSGYMGELAVYHNLHCVVSLSPIRSELQIARRGVICKANVHASLLATTPPLPVPRLLLPKHDCR